MDECGWLGKEETHYTASINIVRGAAFAAEARMPIFCNPVT
jgi:hypothetical protein